MVLVPEVVDAVAPMPVLAAGGIGSRPADGGGDGARRGRRVDRVDLARPSRRATSVPMVIEKLLAADLTRHRALAVAARASRPASCAPRGPRPGSADDCPGTLPMPLQFMPTPDARASHRAGSDRRDLFGMPVGQIVGSMNQVRTTKQVVLDMVEEYIDTVEKMARRPRG